MIEHISPLYDKKVLIPRGKNHAKPVSALVRTFGGIPVEIPLLAFRTTLEAEAALQLKETLPMYDWIVFTSNVTVETFMSVYQDACTTSRPKVAAIGVKTKEALAAANIATDFIPEKYVAEEFVKEFIPLVDPGMKVLIPKGNLARDYISASLSLHGADVEEIIVYETYMPDLSKQLLREKLEAGQLDILLFTSPSTIDHFMSVVDQYKLHDRISNCIISCIGPVSKAKAESCGLKVHVMPEVYTVHNMLKSIETYLIDDKRGGIYG